MQDNHTPVHHEIAHLEKPCSKCKRILALSMFHRHIRMKGGYAAECKRCKNAYKKKWRDQNSEEINLRDREWYRENREAVVARRAEYRRNNRDVESARARRWRESNKERIAEQRRENREYYRQYERNREARKRAGGGGVTTLEWESILAEFDGRCAKCGSSDNIHMDHVVPIARGGRHSADNIQPLCAQCNLRKATKTEDYRGRMYRPLGLPLENDT